MVLETSQGASRGDGASRFAAWAALAVLLAAHVGFAARFARHQALWVDETTQLAGLSLSPHAMVGWLAGRGPDLGVPADRNPPASYLAGQAWSVVVGAGETSLRRFGIVCSVIAIAAIFLAARRAYGTGPGVVGAAFLVLSPNVLGYAVEIRPYPLFLMIAALATYALVRALQADERLRPRWIALTATALALGTLTHFFGVVLAVAFLAALLVDALRRGRSRFPIVTAAAAILLAFASTAPFVLAALRMSTAVAVDAVRPAGGAARIARLAYRLYGHPAMMLWPAGVAVATLGFAGAVTAALAGRRSPDAVGAAVVTALAIGLGIVGVGALSVRGFDASSPHYNVWALPPIALLVSRAVSSATRSVGLAGAAAVAALLAVSGAATGTILARPEPYTHGPQRQVFAAIERLGRDGLVIVHDPGSDAAGQILYPVRYEFGRGLPQYRMGQGGALALFDQADAAATASFDRARTALVIRAHFTGAADLARMLRERSVPCGDLEAADALRRRGWRTESRACFAATISAEMQILRREL